MTDPIEAALDFAQHDPAHGFIAVTSRFNSKVIELALELNNIPTIILKSFEGVVWELYADMLLFLPKENDKIIPHQIFDSIGLRVLEVEQREVKGVIMFMVLLREKG